jgi:hypothetical protein
LTARDWREFCLASENDAERHFNQIGTQVRAQAAEDLFVAWFVSHGIRLQTQAEIVAEGGRITPDILFIDKVVIDGRPVCWIDYKDYVGTKVAYLYKGNLAQAAKYHAKWGEGAMCYGLGYVEGLTFPDTLVIDSYSRTE